MKKLTISLLVILLVLALFIVYFFFKQNQKVFLISEISGTTLTKTPKYQELENFLDEMNFWKANNVTTTRGGGLTTAKRLVVIVTNQKQNAGYLVGGENNEVLYSSFGYREEKGKVTYIIHVDSTQCKLVSCDIDKTINSQLIRGVYQTTNRQNPNNFVDVLKIYDGKYIALVKKQGFVFDLVKTAHAADCSS